MNAYTLFGELKADTKQFQRALRESDSRLESTEKAITQVEGKAEHLGKTTQVTARQFDKLKQSAQEAKQRLDLTATAFAKGEATANQMRSAMVNFEKTQARVNSRLQDTNARLADFANKGLNISGKLQSLGQGLTNIGTTLAIGITAPLALIGKSILTAGIDYEKSLNTLQAVTKATGDEMARAAAQAKILGADITLPATSAGNAAKAMTELAKAGLSVNEAIAASKGVLQLAAAGQLDEAKAAEIAANALNSFKLEAQDTVRVANLLAAAANASSSEVTDIAQSMQQASALFASAKVPIEDLTAAIAIMSNAGVKGSDAGTSLKTFLQRLQSPTDNAASAMQNLGIKIFDAQGKMKDLPQIIGDFDTALSKLTDEKKAQAINQIFGADASRAASILFTEGEKGFKKMLEAVTVSGAAADLAAAKTRGLGGAWEALKSQLETIGIDIFTAIQAPLTSVLQSIASFAGVVGEAFSRLAPSIQIAIIAIAGITAALAPVLIVSGLVVSALASIVSAITAVAGAFAGVSIAPIIAGIAAAVAVAVVAFAAAAAAGAALYAAWQNDFGGIRTFTLEVFAGIKQFIQTAMVEISAFVQTALAGIKAFWAENGADIMKATNTVYSAIADVVKKYLDTFRNFWKVNGEQITAIVKTIWETIKTVVTAGINVVLNLIKLTAAIINGDWSKAWEAAKAIVKIAMDATIAILKGSISIIGNVLLGILNVIKDLHNRAAAAALGVGKAIAQGIANGIKSYISDVVSAARELALAPITITQRILDSHSPSRVFFGIGKDVVQGFVDGINALKASAQNAMVSLLDVSQLKTGKTDKAGVELLSSLANELANIGANSKTAQIGLELTKGAYDKLNPAIKEAITLAAQQIDFTNDLASGTDKLNSAIDNLREGLIPAKTELEKLNELFKDKEVILALNDQASALNTTAAALKGYLQLLATIKGNLGVTPSGAGTGRSGEGGTGLTRPDASIFTDLGVPPALPKAWDNFFKTLQQKLDVFKNSLPSIKEAIGVNLIDSLYGIGNVLGDAFANFNGSFSDFFKDIAAGFRQLVGQIIGEIVRLLVYKAVFALLGSFAGGSVPTGGHEAGHFGGFARGGYTGSGSPGDVAGVVHKREYVMPYEAVKHFGLGFMERLKNLQMPKLAFANGGYTGGAMPIMPSGGTTNNSTVNQPINVYLPPGIKTPEQARQSAYQGAKEALARAKAIETRNR